MAETPNRFWWNQLLAHGWASWFTGYLTALIMVITGSQISITGGNYSSYIFDLYAVGSGNALLLLLLTPIYVPIFGLAFKFKTPPLWAFVILGIVLEYGIFNATTMEIGDIGGAELTPNDHVASVMGGAIYGALVYLSMKSLAQNTGTVPLWDSAIMKRCIKALFTAVLPSLVLLVICIALLTDVSILELADGNYMLAFILLSILISTIFVVITLPHYLAIYALEKNTNFTGHSKKIAVYAVALTLATLQIGIIHMTDFSNPWELDSTNMLYVLWAWSLSSSLVVGYLYNRAD